MAGQDLSHNFDTIISLSYGKMFIFYIDTSVKTKSDVTVMHTPQSF